MPVFYHHKADEIISLLNNIGLNDWSKKITDATTGTHPPVEIAINLHHILKNMKITQPLPPEIKWKIDILIKELDKIIGHHHKSHSH